MIEDFVSSCTFRFLFFKLVDYRLNLENKFLYRLIEYIEFDKLLTSLENEKQLYFSNY